MEAAHSSETSEQTYYPTWCDNPEDRKFYILIACSMQWRFKFNSQSEDVILTEVWQGTLWIVTKGLTFFGFSRVLIQARWVGRAAYTGVGGYTKDRIFGQDTSREKKCQLKNWTTSVRKILKCNLENLRFEGVDYFASWSTIAYFKEDPKRWKIAGCSSCWWIFLSCFGQLLGKDLKAGMK